MRWIGQITYDEVAYFREDVIIEAGNKLGIGTASPGFALDIKTSTSDDGISLSATSGRKGIEMLLDSGTNGGGDIKMYTGSSILTNRITAQGSSFINGGNVGIGTTSPSYPFSLENSGTGLISRIYNTNSNGQGLLIRAGATSSATRAFQVASSNDTKIMTVNSNSRVGIGTTNPASSLHVAGTVQVGVDDTGHDVKFFGATAGSYMLWDESQDRLRLTDDTYLTIGDNDDVIFFHNGSNSYLLNDTGDFYVANRANDKDIIFQSDDGSGGVTEYFRLDGAGTPTIETSVQTNYLATVNLDDNIKLKVGTGNDMEIYHDGSNSYVSHIGTGSLVIQNRQLDQDIILKSDDGSGGETAYLTLDGSAGYTTVQKKIRLDDSVILAIGTGQDLTVQHDGNNTYLNNITGDFYISQKTADKDLILRCDDGSGGETAYLTLDGSSTRIEVAKNMRLADNVSLLVGGSSDLYLKHDGSNSYISQGGTGNLYIQQNTADADLVLQCDDGSGGTTAYLTLDGSASQVLSNVTLKSIPPNANTHSLILGRADTGNVWNVNHAGSDFRLYNTAGSGSDILFGVHSGGQVVANKVGIGVATPASLLHVAGTVQVGVDDTGHDVTFYGDTAGKKMLWQSSTNQLKLSDNVYLSLGDSGDLYARHTGGYGDISNNTGYFYIRNNANDSDIAFQADDGAGGTTTYFSLDGSAATHDGSATTSLHTVWPDNSRIVMGTGSDFYMRHSGSEFLMSNATGTMAFYQQANDGDMKFYCDDGSGGNAVYLTLDGSATRTNVHKNLRFDDNIGAVFGSGAALKLHSDGSNGLIDNFQGNLIIRQQVDDADIIFQSDNGSGGVETYFFLDGSLGRTVFPDNSRLVFGSSSDFDMRHYPSNGMFMNNMSDNLVISNYADDKDIILQSDNGSGGVTPYLTLDGSAGHTVANKEINFADSIRASFGALANGDMALFHDGTNSYINNYTNDLYIRNNADDKDIILPIRRRVWWSCYLPLLRRMVVL